MFNNRIDSKRWERVKQIRNWRKRGRSPRNSPKESTTGLEKFGKFSGGEADSAITGETMQRYLATKKATLEHLEKFLDRERRFYQSEEKSGNVPTIVSPRGTGYEGSSFAVAKAEPDVLANQTQHIKVLG